MPPSLPTERAPWAPLVLETTGAHRVLDVEVVQSLWSGYGQILRCRLEGGKHGSVVVKHVRWPTSQDHPRGWNSDVSHQRKVHSYEVESAWYRRHAGSCELECRVPDCLGLRTHGDQVFMVLEDLNDSGFCGRRTQVRDGELRACLSWLAHFHATWMGREPEGLWGVGTYWHLATRPDEFDVLGDGPLKDAAVALDRKLSATRFCSFVHGDAKLANFCFSPDGTGVAAVDFQYVGGGCGMKDLAYFLGSCLDEAQCEERETELLDFYFQCLRAALAKRKTQVDFQELESDWRGLYPVAWADFHRFLLGWSPGHWKIHRYSERMVAEALANL